MNLTAKLTRMGVMLVVLASVGRAGPVLWDLQGVTFTDGASGTGYFLFDANLSQVFDWNIVTASSGNGATSGGFLGFDYSPVTSVALANSSGCVMDFVDDLNPSRSLCLNPESPLIAGATPALLPTSYESFDSAFCLLTG